MGHETTTRYARHFAQYWSLTVAWLRRLGVAAADAEDVAASLWLRLHRRWPWVEEALADAAPTERALRWRALLWLFARRAAWVRRRQLARQQNVLWMAQSAATTCADDVEWLATRRELRHALARALEGLDGEQRTVWILRRVEERPGRQVADRLGLSESAVQRRLLEAEQVLRRALGPTWSPRSAVVRATKGAA